MPQPLPLLLSPVTVGPLTLRNRVVMGSMHTGLDDRARHTDRLAAFYTERARHDVGLIVTGGCSPDVSGWLLPFGSMMATRRTADRHRAVTDAVHAEGGAIALQLLHAGRYGYSPLAAAPSSLKSPISPFRPRALTTAGVQRTVEHFVRAARLARRAGYDAVEIMGSEGYLLNQFLAARTNRRTDAWGGSADRRRHLPVEVVRRVVEAVGDDLAVVYRISLVDLVEDGQTWDDVLALAHELEQVGVHALGTGIGWHEARVPTILSQVPRAAWASLTARLRAHVDVPVMAANRINTPEVAERLLADGTADLVSMARPFLADPALVTKAAAGRSDEIMTCIACNQACLDATFANRTVSCLLNPRAGRETELVLLPVPETRRRAVAVVGAGPAGLATAVAAAERGLRVTLFDAADELGGQFRLAMRVPGKEEFAHALAAYDRQLQVRGVDVRLRTHVRPADVVGYDDVVVATGVVPRAVAFPGHDDPRVVSYAAVLAGDVVPGPRVAVIGAGGIGVDVSTFLVHEELPGDHGTSGPETVTHFLARWGVDETVSSPGGLAVRSAPAPARQVWLLQRKTSRIGAGLGRTSGWAHRMTLRDNGIEMIPGVSYDRFDDAGLHLTLPSGASRVLPVDHVVVCAGQESERSLYDALVAAGRTPYLVGGADVCAELDAERAIREGTELASRL